MKLGIQLLLQSKSRLMRTMEEVLHNQKYIEKRLIYLENALMNKLDMESIKQNFMSTNINLKDFE